MRLPTASTAAMDCMDAPSGGLPVSTFDSANYWVDVIYSSSNTYSISGNVSGNGDAGATVALAGPKT